MLFAFNFASAQHLVPGATDYHELALLFSQYTYKGSSRMQGLGGAQISLGGDLSSALSNPAGLGFYNRSEFSFTPSVNAYSADARYLGQQTETIKPKFNFDQFGVAFHKKYKDNAAGFVGGTFAITYSKVNEFHYDVELAGFNPTNDILDYYVTEANRQNMAPEDLAGLPSKAFYSYLISEFYDVYDDGTEVPFYRRTFFTEVPNANAPTEQIETIETYGSQNFFSFAYGVNLNDRFYLGANLNLASINYDIQKNYQEFYPEGNIVSGSATWEDLRTEGTGAGLTLGTIVRPASFFTLGASIMTPTWYSMSEEYFNGVSASYDNFDMASYGQYFNDNYDAITPSNPEEDYVETYTEYDPNDVLNYHSEEDDLNIFEYNFVSPMRLNGGATFFIGKYGFISADAEWVDYSNMKLKGEGDSLEDQEQLIKSSYKDVVNLKVGAEGRIDNFRIRAGYSFHPSPFVDKANQHDINKFAFGGGYRNAEMFVDVAATYLQSKANYSPYVFSPDVESEIFATPVSTIDYSDLNINFTVGFFF